MYACEPKAEVDIRDSAGKSSKDEGPKMERSLKCLRMERNQLRKYLGRELEITWSPENSIFFCSCESYIIL